METSSREPAGDSAEMSSICLLKWEYDNVVYVTSLAYLWKQQKIQAYRYNQTATLTPYVGSVKDAMIKRFKTGKVRRCNQRKQKDWLMSLPDSASFLTWPAALSAQQYTHRHRRPWSQRTCQAGQSGAKHVPGTWTCMAESFHSSPERMTRLLTDHTPVQNVLGVK